MNGIGPISAAWKPNILVGPAWNVQANGSVVFDAANAARFMAFTVDAPVLASTAYFRVAVASGNMDVGIYSDAGVRLGSTGSFAVPAASSSSSKAMTAAVVLVPGVRYWAAIACDNTTASFGAQANITNPTVPGYVYNNRVAASMPLPASVTFGTSQFSGNWFLAFA